MGHTRLGFLISCGVSMLVAQGAAGAGRTKPAAEPAPGCEGRLNAGPRLATTNPWTLDSFFDSDPDKNLALKHPLVLANAAEKAYALIMHRAPRVALDPLYKVRQVQIFPMLAGEDDATGGRRVVGQEFALESFVAFLHSAARGDRMGKTLGFPGPAGTGKTELFYVLDRIERTLGQQDKYKTMSYRFRNLYKLPRYHKITRYSEGPGGTKIAQQEFFNPEFPRSPFTLLRPDMQKKLLDDLRPKIKGRFNILISNSWTEPEPKTREFIREIFEHEYPEIRDGRASIDDVPAEDYLRILNEYVVIVPRETVRPRRIEAMMLDPQSENANIGAWYASENMGRKLEWTADSEMAFDYTGKIYKFDGQLLPYNELFRNPGELLNMQLEMFQNQIAMGDVGFPVHMDTFAIWNANDESIEESKGKAAVKAIRDRTESRPMRLLVHPNQIEAVIPLQVGAGQFRMRRLDTEDAPVVPFEHQIVYPAVDATGRTETARGRYALYYVMDGAEYLVSPYTLNFMAWMISASRLVTEKSKFEPFAQMVDLRDGNDNLWFDPINRVRALIGDYNATKIELQTLFSLHGMLKEGAEGISTRDTETWIKQMLAVAHQKDTRVLTPRIANLVFIDLLRNGGFQDTNHKVAAYWYNLRKAVAQDMLLPRLRDDVRTIMSGEGNQADRIYEEFIHEMEMEAEDRSGRTPEELGINVGRRDKIKELYKKVSNGREFNFAMITRLMREAPGGEIKNSRDRDLLQAIRELLADSEKITTSHIAELDRYYRRLSDNPEIRQKDAEITGTLPSFGYDKPSFREAVEMVAQLQADVDREELAKKKQGQ